MSGVDPVKLARHRQRLHEEWTEEATVSAWRKWHTPLAAFTRGATDLGSGVIGLAEELARAPGLHNIEFRVANVESLPFLDLGSPEEYWRRFIEVAAPFRPLVATLTGEIRARAEAEIFAERRKLFDGSIITMPLEIVVGTGLRT
jgi:hypothetical protein